MVTMRRRGWSSNANPQARHAIPCSWREANRWLGDEKFIQLPHGRGMQLQRNGADEILFMFNRRLACKFTRSSDDGVSDQTLVLYGHVFAEQLEGTLDVVNMIVRSFTTHCSVMRYARGQCAVVLRKPSQDIARPEGDPFVLDKIHTVTIFNGSSKVIGMPWRPFGCRGTDDCPCRYCQMLADKRMDAIASAIAGGLE